MKKKLKAVLFDMDGVLFDSMPYHSEAWHKVMKSHGLTPVSYTHLPLNGQVLLDAGADLLFPSMQALNDTWDMMTENDI